MKTIGKEILKDLLGKKISISREKRFVLETILEG